MADVIVSERVKEEESWDACVGAELGVGVSTDTAVLQGGEWAPVAPGRFLPTAAGLLGLPWGLESHMARWEGRGSNAVCLSAFSCPENGQVPCQQLAGWPVRKEGVWSCPHPHGFGPSLPLSHSSKEQGLSWLP